MTAKSFEVRTVKRLNHILEKLQELLSDALNGSIDITADELQLLTDAKATLRFMVETRNTRLESGR